MVDPEFDAFCQSLGTNCTGAMRVFGVRRSGQHAVIDWILRNCGTDDRMFLNNRRIGQTPLRAGKLAEKKPDSTKNAEALRRQLARRIARGQRPFLLISYEHGYAAPHYKAGDISPGFSNSDFDREVIITRRFVNWLPSYIRLAQGKKPRDSLDASQAILRGIGAYKAHLIAANNSPHTHISYDDWVADPGYRRQKLKALGLPEQDNSLGQMQPYGGGSSFSGSDMAPHSLAATERWKTLAEDSFAAQFLAIAEADAELQEALASFYPDDINIIRQLLA